MSSYKGVSLFTDVEDKELQERNRAVVMVNMFEDNMGGGKRVSAKGLSQILGYFNTLPKDERKGVYSKFSAELVKRGLTKLH